MKILWTEIRTSLALTLVLAVIVSGAYPAAVWAIGRVFWSDKADGSLVHDASGQIRGSALLAQSFASPGYFHPRPSAAGTGYDATNSGGTNLGPTSDKLLNGSHARDSAGKPLDDPSNFDGIKDLVAEYRSANHLAAKAPVPADAVTRSGSGLDPDISLENARLQAPRVAAARHLPLAEVLRLLAGHTSDRDLGLFGEPRVNVLLLNLALDRVKP